MTEALDAMVKAMAAEAARLAPRTISPAAGFILVEGESAMREIARAGLAALNEWPGELPPDTWMVENSEDARQVWTHLVGAILERRD